MASLARKAGVYFVRFRFQGQQYKRSLRCRNASDAECAKAIVEQTLYRLRTGQLQVRPDVDLGDFIVSGGTLLPPLPPPAILPAVPSFTELQTDYLAHIEHVAAPSYSGSQRTHLKQFSEFLKSRAQEPITLIADQDIQKFINRQLVKLDPNTVNKQRITLVQFYKYVVKKRKLLPLSPMLNIDKISFGYDRSPFRTKAEIEGIIARGGLDETEKLDLWECLYLNPTEIAGLLNLVRRRAEFETSLLLHAIPAYTDLEFLKGAFHKLMLNFTWWANRKDRFGKNVFEGGFLGLDNIGVFDRSAPLPTGGHLEQADGTAWMALFSQNMTELAVELAAHDPIYEDMVLKFAEQFYYIAAAMNRPGQDGMWDEEDGFYYDILRLPDGTATRLKVRSLVGLLPLCATTVIEPWQRERIPRAMTGLLDRLRRIPELGTTVHPVGPGHLGVNDRGILAVLNPERLRRVLTRMLDENEFFGPHGIRSISKFHEQHPYVYYANGQEYRVDYLPAESNTGMFGGNSNWRGPVWMPVNAMIIRALLQYYLYYGDNFKIECPTGSGHMMNLFEVSQELSNRLTGIFLRDEQGRRPVYGGTEKFQNDPHWRDLLLFFEYFHGDNGAGLGASHQTGWTGLVAKFIELYGSLDAKRALEGGKLSAFKKDNR